MESRSMKFWILALFSFSGFSLAVVDHWSKLKLDPSNFDDLSNKSDNKDQSAQVALHQVLARFSNELMKSNMNATFSVAPIPLHQALLYWHLIFDFDYYLAPELEKFLGCNDAKCLPLILAENSSEFKLISTHKHESGDHFLLPEQAPEWIWKTTGCNEQFCPYWNIQPLGPTNDEVSILSGSSHVFGLDKAKIVEENIAHNFECRNARFQMIQKEAKYHIFPHTQAQLLEFDLDAKSAIQLSWPIDSDFLGFEVFDVLINVARMPMNILFPIVALKNNFKAKEVLLGSSSSVNEPDQAIKDIQQFNILSIFPASQEKQNCLNESTLSIKGPFVYRIIEKSSLSPLNIGLIACPSGDSIQNTKLRRCLTLKKSCKTFNMCNKLDDICSSWDSCRDQ